MVCLVLCPHLVSQASQHFLNCVNSKASRLTNRIKRFRTGTRDKPKATEPKCESPKQLSMKKLEKALSLSIAYAANVGGIASLTGPDLTWCFLASHKCE